MSKVYNWDEVFRLYKRDGVNMRVISGDNIMLVLNELDSRATPSLHKHGHEQMTYILTGECDFVIGDEVLKLKAGDVVPIKPNVEHSLKVTSKEPVLNLDVFYPVRQDFLDYINKTERESAE